MNILVTGAAGFIGYHLCEKLLILGFNVIGLDNLNDYYDVNLKLARLSNLGIDEVNANLRAISSTHNERFIFYKINLEDRDKLSALFKDQKIDIVCNLAAQAGVRYSIDFPMKYIESNVSGFVNLLECMRHNKTAKLIYASSSSVYGNSDKVPFSTEDNVDHPISLYAATKKANELMAHTYSHLFNIQTIGLRFFTVYGPWGRPDMAMFLFTDAILNDKPIKVFNDGELYRDFTYIDDIINGITATVLKENDLVYSIYNIGNSKSEKLLDFIQEIERATNKSAIKVMYPMQPGDVYKTWADVTRLKNDYEYCPKISIKEGIENFVKWYKEFYKIE